MNKDIISASYEGSYCQDFKSYQPEEKNGSVDSEGDFIAMEIESKQNSNDFHSGRFTNQIEFWLTCLGFAVGYGNIWRFPYMLYRNGGGAFLIPWAICIVVFVFPLAYLEVTYGQLYRRSIHRYFDSIHSRLLGLGFAINTVSFYINLYYMCLVQILY